MAKVLSRWTGGELLRLQCYEGIDAAQAVYEWDYSRQLLHLRAVEVTLGTILKYREDQDRTKAAGLDQLVRAAAERSG